MSNLYTSLYDEVIEGLTYNRELEIYYDDFTYGIVTYGESWQLWKDKELLAEYNDFLSFLNCNMKLNSIQIYNFINFFKKDIQGGSII